ncbi:Rho GTPase activation protein [Dichotomocladium elegans]|nr:Rho GTPase activation protein [Dichotomocladium elegans]
MLVEARTATHPLTDVPVNDLLTHMDDRSIANADSRRMMLPSSLQQDINQFAIDGFAQKYFATHKRGLFRRRVPMKEMLEWTKDSLNKPLITLNKDLYKDAQRCFKMIQTVMGDRPRSRMSSDVEDIQAILNCGISKGQMRDEIYVQLCKQLHHNPRGESIRKGWELLCIVCITFPPSKNLESYLNGFVQHHHQIKENDVDVMSLHVSAKLKRICVRGAKGKVLTAAEIERAKIAPFKPSVFGESLEFIMGLEAKKKKEEEEEGGTVDGEQSLQIPRIVPFLADAVIRTNGQRSEGIFRVPGDADAITDLRVRIENGNYDASGITDPNVPASLLKYWIRDLPEPLICAEYYDSCVACNDDAEKAIGIINSLPDTNRRIVLYMLAFLQEFIDPEVIKHTLMNVSNLAMVFAPNLLRCPSEALTTVLKNSKFEQGFLRTLLLELEADKQACAYSAESERVRGKRKSV